MVMNNDLHVLVWNRRAEDLWGLRREEAIGKHFLNLDIGLPVDLLRPMIKETLNGNGHPHEVVVPAINRRGRNINVRVVCAPLDGSDSSSVSGAILVMDPDEAMAG